MKKIVIFLACILVCVCLFSACTNSEGSNNSSIDTGNAVEVDIDVEEKSNADVSSGDIDYEFKDPENSNGIEVVPKE